MWLGDDGCGSKGVMLDSLSDNDNSMSKDTGYILWWLGKYVVLPNRELFSVSEDEYTPDEDDTYFCWCGGTLLEWVFTAEGIIDSSGSRWMLEWRSEYVLLSSVESVSSDWWWWW